MPKLTITTSDSEAARLSTAVGALLGLRGTDGLQRAATGAEIKDWLVSLARQCVLDYETGVARRAVAARAVFEPT